MPSFQIPQCCGRPMAHTKDYHVTYWECSTCRTRKNDAGKVIFRPEEDLFTGTEPTLAERLDRMP